MSVVMEKRRAKRRGAKRRLKVADLFCGAGGTSTGALLAFEDRGDVDMDLVAINHDETAIATHEANHPCAHHVRDELERVHPRDLVKGRLDLLLASPECTEHSRAKGGKPVNDQRRMSAWQVVRWVSDTRPRAFLVENVPEFEKWGPLDVTGKRPLPSRARETFEVWLQTLRGLGYSVDFRVITAADHGDATTRERLFVAGLEGIGRTIPWPQPTHSQHGAADLFGAGARRWRPAAECILWALKGRSIFHRDKLLSKNTHLRIFAGAVRFLWPQDFLEALVELLRFQGVPQDTIEDVARRALAGAARSGGALLMRSENTGGNGIYSRPVEDPAYTVTTNGGLALAEPFVGVHRRHADARSLGRPLPTLCAGGTHLGLAEAFVVNRHGENGGTRAHGVVAPLPTATRSGGGYLASPLVMQANQGKGRTRNIRAADESPLQTVVTGDSLALARPFVLSQGAGGAPRSTEAPVPTIPTEGAHALVAPYNRTGRCKATSEPLPTATTRDRLALVTPVTHTDRSNRARSVREPLPTVTSAARGELAFIAAAFGERRGQLPRTHSLEAPAPTIAAKGRINLVRAFVTERGIDIRYRMLQPLELARSMSFPDSYRWAGNKTQVTEQIGNAVPVQTARALVRALLDAVLGAPA